MKFCTFCLTLLFANFIANPIAFAQSSVGKTATQQSVKTQKIKKETKLTPAVIDEDDIVPNINKSLTFDYKCELNNKLIIYTNTNDDKHAALHWKNKLYYLKRIETTTGANRFENKKAGLVWIAIPTKGMLLDSLHGQQLANECKTVNQ